MFRRFRFQCEACMTGFIDWHDEEWERTPVFCVNCGTPILAGFEVDVTDTPVTAARRETESALGVLKGAGTGFRDTLPGLKAAPSLVPGEDELEPVSLPDREHEPKLELELDQAPDSELEPESGSVPEFESDPEPESRPPAPRAFARATSERPAPDSAPRLEPRVFARRRRSKRAPLMAMLLGFAVGVPLTLLGEAVISRVWPSSRPEVVLSKQLAAVTTALDDGDLTQARRLLEQTSRRVSVSDRRVATLRARLALSLILANRPDDARRELSALHGAARIYPARDQLERAYAALFAPQAVQVAAALASPPSLPSTSRSLAPTAAPAKLASPVPAPTKPAYSPQVMLAAARDRQRRSRLDEAQRLYEEVLRYRPGDSEARCGLAEVELLRGSVAEAEALFESSLRNNGNYIPAWVALGDIDWLRGRPERAACRYQIVVDRFPEGSYPPYIAQRIARVLGSGVKPPSARSEVSGPEACD